MKDVIFEKIQKYMINGLRFSKRNQKKWELSEPFKKNIYDYSIKNYKKWDKSFEHSNPVFIKNRILNILENMDVWVDENYKNKKWESNRNKENYQKNRGDRMTCKENGKMKEDINHKKTLESYNRCIEQGIKPTIKNCMELSRLSKNTTNKYLKIIKNKG